MNITCFEFPVHEGFAVVSFTIQSNGTDFNGLITS